MLETGNSCNPRTIDADNTGAGILEALLVGVREKIQEASAVAGRIVKQVLLSMRTVYSYVGEKWTVKSYEISLEQVLKLGIKQGLIKGMAIGSRGISYAFWAF